MKQVTVVTQPGCQPCWATKQKLTDLGIEFTEVSAGEAVDKLTAYGITSVPAVFVNDNGNETYWTGYRPDAIKELA